MFFKTLDTETDLATTRTLLNEVIPLTGSIVSGTYSEANIKTYTHGMFQSVFDYPYLSSSANHIFDITCGFSSNSSLSGATGATQVSKKINIYNQFCQLLAGYDITGSLLKFDRDGSNSSTGTKMKEVFIVPFSRLLTKDEVKKGSFVFNIGVGSYSTPFTTTSSIGDYQATSSYLTNSPAGEYGLLYVSGSTTSVGHIYYQAGVAVLTASVFGSAALSGTAVADATLASGTIDTFANSLRHRMNNVQFNNTTELNSTIYFCRANHNQFNYSSNPTYLSGSQIRVKNVSTDTPVAFITTVGLYDSTDNLVAVAKLSEPLRKDPSTELTLRVRLDY